MNPVHIGHKNWNLDVYLRAALFMYLYKKNGGGEMK